ncbi:MAG: tryptophan--tRNA ligase, partial [Thermoplasmata archaeon]|nr:tryptophan--tRNA ligase [Thermoplasmata archaeon]
ICAIYQYLYYFFDWDDDSLNNRRERCLAGDLLCGECKQYLTGKVTDFIEKHQEKREKARDVIEDYMLRD